MKGSECLWGSIICMVVLYLTFNSRGDVPKDGPLVFIGALLFLVLIGIGGILDMLRDLGRRLK